VTAEDLAGEVVEVAEGVDVGVGVVWGCGDELGDFGAEFGLDGGVGD